MNFLECIQTAVTDKRLSENKGAEAAEAYESAKANGLAEGLSEAQAEDLAAHKALEEVTNYTQNKRWQRINEMRKMHQLHERIMNAPKPVGKVLSVLDDVLDETYMTSRAVQGQLMALIPEVLEKYSPKKGGLVNPIDNMDNIIREIYGESAGSPEARAMAKATMDVIDQARKMLNLEGASIPENPNYRFPQTHERGLVRQAGKTSWVEDHLRDGVLDWDIMKYEGKSIPVDKRQEVLEKVYDAIVTEGNIKVNPGQPDNTSLASRLSRERFLYYANADAWLEMQGKYGTGNFYHQLIEHIDSTARSVALMRTFGPNTDSGRQYAERLLRRRVGDMQAADTKQSEKLGGYLKNALDRFNNTFDILARRVNVGEGDALATNVNTFFSVTGTALLGNAVVSNLFGDLSIGMWTRGIYKMPQWHVIPAYLSAITGGKKFTQQMIDNGIVIESFVNRAYEMQRYNVALEGAGWARTISDINYRLQGASLLTDRGRGVAGMDFQKALASVRGKKFDDIPFVAQMRNLGITEKDWELVRDMPLYEPQYYSFGRGKFFRPIDMYKNAATDAERAAANKFLTLQEAFVRDLVPGHSLRAKYMLGGDVSQTRFAGRILKSSMQLALFPASIMFTHWRKIAEAPRFHDRVWRAGTFFLYTTIAGALIAQTKELLKGNGPAPMDNWDFWLRSMALGGGGAIIGDFIYDNIHSANDYYSAETPAEGQFNRFKKLMKSAWGEMSDPQTDHHLPKAAIDFAWGLVPKPTPYRLAMERLITDPLLEWSDPAAYQRKIQAQQEREQAGQGTWWGVGD